MKVTNKIQIKLITLQIPFLKYYLSLIAVPISMQFLPLWGKSVILLLPLMVLCSNRLEIGMSLYNWVNTTHLKLIKPHLIPSHPSTPSNITDFLIIQVIYLSFCCKLPSIFLVIDAAIYNFIKDFFKRFISSHNNSLFVTIPIIYLYNTHANIKPPSIF